EITRITVKLPIDAPLRTNILARLGQVGADAAPQNVPSFLEGSYPIGVTSGGLNRVVSTHAITPYTTVTDLARALSPLVTHPTDPKLQNLAGEFNPIIAALLQSYASSDRSYPLIEQVFRQPLEGLPQAKVVQPRHSKLYPNRSRWDYL